MGNGNNMRRATSLPIGLALGAAVSMGVTLMISFIGAQLILSEVMDQGLIGYCSLAALLLGAIMGAMTSAAKVQRRRMLVCLLSGLVYFCILLSVTALFFGGQYEGVAVSFVTVTLGSIGAALLHGEGKRRNHHRRKKI